MFFFLTVNVFRMVFKISADFRPNLAPRPLETGRARKMVQNAQNKHRRPTICSVYPKAVWLEMFGPVFPEISAESDPRDPLDRRGPPRT